MVQKFKKKPVIIEAVQWTGNNPNEVSQFMGRCKVIDKKVRIQTLEGTVYASQHDWIIKGVQGEFYPCKPDIFEATYEAI